MEDPFYKEARKMFDIGTAEGTLLNKLRPNKYLVLSLDSEILNLRDYKLTNRSQYA